MATAFNSTKVTTNPRPNLKDAEATRNGISKTLDQFFNIPQKDALIDAMEPDSKLYGPDSVQQQPQT